MKKKYTAIIKNENGHFHRVDTDYSSKKAYAQDCRGNGYKVTAILTDTEIEYIKAHGWQSGMKYSDITIDFVLQCL